ARYVYDVDAYHRAKAQGAPPQPMEVSSVVRESQLAGTSEKIAVQRAVAYFDGSGRPIQTKSQAPPGKDARGGAQDRWLSSGLVLYNNKGDPVQVLEPFFSPHRRFDLEAHGKGSVCFTD